MSNATPTRSHRPAAGRRHTAQPPVLLNRILQGLEAVESSGLDLRDQSRDPNRWDGARSDLRQLGLEIDA